MSFSLQGVPSCNAVAAGHTSKCLPGVVASFALLGGGPNTLQIPSAGSKATAPDY